MTFRQTIYCALMGVLAFVGLALASQAHNNMLAYLGYALVAFGIVNIFVLIHRSVGRHVE